MVTFHVHLEAAAEDVVWWAEADVLPGVSVAADSFAELRALAIESVAEHCAPGTKVSYQLVAAEPEPAPTGTPVTVPDEVSNVGPVVSVSAVTFAVAA